MTGVIVLGELEVMDQARRRAQQFRLREYAAIEGGDIAPRLPGPYVPPPGHEVVVIEEDLSLPGSAASQPRATNGTAKTKAQECAERRRRMLADTD